MGPLHSQFWTAALGIGPVYSVPPLIWKTLSRLILLISSGEYNKIELGFFEKKNNSSRTVVAYKRVDVLPGRQVSSGPDKCCTRSAVEHVHPTLLYGTPDH
jgi:hypothetical protein